MTCDITAPLILKMISGPRAMIDVLVPIVGFDVFLQFGGVGKRGDVAAAVFVDHHLLAAARS